MVGKENTKHYLVKLDENNQPVKLTINDIPQIVEIYKSNWGNSGIFNFETFKSIIQQNLSFAYKVGDDLIGFCLMEYMPNVKIIEVSLLCIRRELQGNHLGKRLLIFCINYSRKLKYKKFSLHVSTGNIPAFNLYSKLGFRIEKQIKKYYHDENPKFNDAYYMTLNL